MVLEPVFIGGLGGPELLIIVFLAVLLFGANKIPELARSTGKAMGEFQKGREEVEEELSEMKDGGDQSNLEESKTETETETADES